jgi:hypothetical protein
MDAEEYKRKHQEEAIHTSSPTLDVLNKGVNKEAIVDAFKDAPDEIFTGLRFDEGKNRLDLLPPEWTWALGLVMTKGAVKYDARNWEKGMPWSKVMGPLKRHLTKFEAGETYDDETGCHHLAMVAWNALALLSYDIRELGTDDLGLTDIQDFDRLLQQEPLIEEEEPEK